MSELSMLPANNFFTDDEFEYMQFVKITDWLSKGNLEAVATGFLVGKPGGAFFDVEITGTTPHEVRRVHRTDVMAFTDAVIAHPAPDADTPAGDGDA